MTRVNAQPEALFDAWLKACPSPHAILGAPGVRQPRTKRGGARGLAAEWPAPLGSAPPARHGTEATHGRPGTGPQTGPTAPGPRALAVPRARAGRWAPQGGAQRHRRLAGCDATVGSLSARGLATRARGPRGRRRSARRAPLRAWRPRAPGRPGRAPPSPPASLLRRGLSTPGRRGSGSPTPSPLPWASPGPARRPAGGEGCVSARGQPGGSQA